MSAGQRLRAARSEIERITSYGASDVGMLSPLVLQAELGKRITRRAKEWISKKLGNISARTRVVLSHPGAKKVKESMVAVIASAAHERLLGSKLDPNSVDLKSLLGKKYDEIMNKPHKTLKSLVKDVVNAIVETKNLNPGKKEIRQAIRDGMDVGFGYLSGVRVNKDGTVLADINRGVVLDLANNGKVIYEVKPKEGEKYIVSMKPEEKRQFLALLEKHGLIRKGEDYFDLVTANIAMHALRNASSEQEAKSIAAEKLHEQMMTDQMVYDGAVKKIEKDKSLFYSHVLLSAIFKKFAHVAQGLAIGIARAAASVLSMVPIVGAAARGMAELGETVAMSAQMVDYETNIWANPKMLPTQEPAVMRAAQKASGAQAQGPGVLQEQPEQLQRLPAMITPVRPVSPPIEEIQKEVQRQVARKKVEEAMRRQMEQAAQQRAT